MKKINEYEERIAAGLNLYRIKYVREFMFDNPTTKRKRRMFRFDFAIPEYKIAVEFEGAIFANGRHNTGPGFHRDCDKYNMAVCQGWKVLRYTSNHLRNNGHIKVGLTVHELISRSGK